MRQCPFLALMSFLLVACSSIPIHSLEVTTQTTTILTPIAQPTKMPKPTLASWTPIPIPLTHTPCPTPASAVVVTPTLVMLPLTRTWEVGPVILEFMTLVEDPAPFGVSRTAALILYSDGRLVIQSDTGFQERHLSRQEICALLNTIDQTGFFDLDMSPYYEQLNELPLGVVSATVIEVNAWQRRQVYAEALWEVIDDSSIEVPFSLRAVYSLLSNYQPVDLQPYQYEQLAFTIHKCSPDYPYRAETIWSLGSPSLEELFEMAEETDITNREWGFGLLLKGDTAMKIYQEISQIPFQGFVEDGETYIVSARPLLPYESLESAVSYKSEIPSLGIVTNTVVLTCYSTDGVLEIP